MGLDFVLAMGQRDAAAEAVDQWRSEDQRVEDLLKQGSTAWLISSCFSLGYALSPGKGLYVVGRNVFLLLLNFSAWPKPFPGSLWFVF